MIWKHFLPFHRLRKFGYKWIVDDSCMLSRFNHARIFAALWTVALQALVSMRFSRQEYWSGLPSPRNLPDPGIEPTSLMSPASAGPSLTTGSTWSHLEAFIKGFQLKIKWIRYIKTDTCFSHFRIFSYVLLKEMSQDFRFWVILLATGYLLLDATLGTSITYFTSYKYLCFHIHVEMAKVFWILYISFNKNPTSR